MLTKKYEQLIRKQSKEPEDIVYLNACDCLFFGCGYQHLNKCGLDDDKAKEIWKKAREDMAND